MESIFVKLILVLSIFGFFLFFVNNVLRKWLNVERKKIFTYGHVNDKHKKLDWTIRFIFTVLLFISFFTNVIRDPIEQSLVFENTCPFVCFYNCN